jgi:hypothetical protein
MAMSLDSVSAWIFFLGTVLLVMGSIEVGYRLGDLAHRKSADEKESTMSGVAGAVLGLTAFIMAFSFSVVAERYQSRKSLVRDDANAIRVAYVRADFLPEADRAASKRLLKTYLDTRLAFAQTGHAERDVGPFLARTDAVQKRLWRIAVSNAERDMNSDVAALYIESLNELASVQSNRLAIGVRARVPPAIWIVLYSLTILGMVSMGYHAGIAGSRRSKAAWMVAVAFAMVITLIAMLDRPGYVRVTQQPLIDLRQFISAEELERK